MLLSSLIDDFINYSTVERGLSPRTMKSWRNILRGFHRYPHRTGKGQPVSMNDEEGTPL